MNISLLNGSPRAKGNTFLALGEIAKDLKGEGIVRGYAAVPPGTKEPWTPTHFVRDDLRD